MKTKLKVSTRTYNFNQKSQKILEVMHSYPEGITPKELGRQTGINVNTIKSILPKLKNIKKAIRGLYKVFEWGDAPPSSPFSELRSWNFHNCVLSGVIPSYSGSFIQTSHSLNLLNLEFILTNSGRCTLRLSSDFPLNISSICLMAGYFQEQINKYSKALLSYRQISVKTIEFNRDYTNLRLDGVKCITLDNLVEQFKVYQKKLGLRIEHKTKVLFNVQNVIDMLTTDPNSMDLRLNLSKQKEQLDRLTIATSQHTQLLFKVIDNLKAQAGE